MSAVAASRSIVCDPASVSTCNVPAPVVRSVPSVAVPRKKNVFPDAIEHASAFPPKSIGPVHTMLLPTVTVESAARVTCPKPPQRDCPWPLLLTIAPPFSRKYCRFVSYTPFMSNSHPSSTVSAAPYAPSGLG